MSSGGVLLFLDSDVGIPDNPDYLRKIVMKMEHTDVLDIKKRVIKDKSFLSKMAYYEYLTFNISSWIASRFMHKCPAVNGAAFAIKREMFDKTFVIDDTINKLKWKMTGESKTILGLPCMLLPLLYWVGASPAKLIS